MWKRCGQVALTYFTRKLLLLIVGFYVLMSIPFLFIGIGSNHPDQFAREVGLLFPKLFWLAYVGFFLGAHLKQQFANPRARLMPGFAGPHLTFSMVLLGLLLAWSILPAVGSPSISVLGFSAIALHLGALALRLGCSPDPIGTAVFLATIGLPMTAVGRALTAEIITGTEPILAIAIISAHVASLVLLLNHLMKLDEDAPDYSKVQALNAWDLKAATQRNFQRNVALSDNWILKVISGSAAARLERATLVPATTAGQRTTLFGLGDNWPTPLWMNQIMIGTMEVGLLMATGAGDSINSSKAFRSAMLMPMAISLALVMGQWGQWVQRWSRLGYESLRPVSRRDWVWENGLAIVKSVALNQTIAVIMQLLIVAVFLPKFLTDPALVEAVIWFIGCQVVLFGVCGWLTTYGSVLVISLLMTPCYMVLLAPWMISNTAMEQPFGVPLTVCLSLLMTLFGVWLCRKTFRRWCLMDLP